MTTYNPEQDLKDLYNSLINKRCILNRLSSQKYSYIVDYLCKKYPMLSDPKYSLGMKVFWCLNGYTDFPKCIQCGKPNKTHRCSYNGYRTEYCSKKCSVGELAKNKARDTNMVRFGVDNCSKNPEIMEKRRQTNLNRYGVEWTLQHDETKEKIKRTKVLKYGNPHYVNEEKQRKTNLERYGTENIFSLPEMHKRAREKMKQIYGYEYASQVPEFKQKISNKNSFLCRTNSYQNFLMTNPYSEPNFTEDFYITNFDKEREFEFICKKCQRVFTSRVHNGCIRRCPECYSSITTSGKEQELYDFLRGEYFGDIIRKNRSIIPNKEIDIVIPDKKLAIEFDGMYWHSELNGIDKNYHLMKTIECENAGYQLIHIFEDEWDNKQTIVKSRLKNLLGIYDNIIYARKCKVIEVDNKTTSNFLISNHIQGDCVSSIRLGLVYNDILVSIMTFSKRRIALGSKPCENGYELLRFCSLLGNHVIGAAGKLLAFFERKYKPETIISYADRRWSIGKLYKTIGFKLDHISKPNYWYLNNGCSERFHRFTFRKSVLETKLDVFNKELSEVDNMRLNRYTRIWDCGNYVFVK